MPKVENFVKGAPCWADLSTVNGEESKLFYTKLFSWDVEDNPTGDGGVYSMYYKNGEVVAASFEMPKEIKKTTPPSWNVYFNTDDVDNSCELVKKAGGKVVLPPFDVMDAGKMAGVVDSGGAFFNLWQKKSHKGAGIWEEEGAITWVELATKSKESAKNFYITTLGCGWEEEESKMEDVSTKYVSLSFDGALRAGCLEIGPSWGATPPHWAVYFGTKDITQTKNKALELGASVVMEPTKVEEVGTFTLLRDPHGAYFYAMELLSWPSSF